MRASDVRAAIATAMKAVPPDARAGKDDVFTFLDQPRDPDIAQERSFRVALTMQPMLDPEYGTCDGQVATWDLTVYYPWSPTIDDRIAVDSERIDSLLSENALVAINADIQHVILAPLGVFEAASLLSARWSVTVHYRCHEVLS